MFAMLMTFVRLRGILRMLDIAKLTTLALEVTFEGWSPAGKFWRNVRGEANMEVEWPAEL
ncbi:MAG: hypothetical protein ACTS6A_02155 [Candidatus Hodgkinia cicadicola]